MRRFISTVLLAVLTLASISAARADIAVRVALLTGEGDRAVDEAMTAQLEAALTGVKDVTLLERAQIKKILAEQKLSASGLSDPATAVRIGRLLPVDVFLLLERLPQSKPASYRAQCVEAQTGVLLAARWLEETQVTGTAAELKALLGTAAARQRIPANVRHYVGVLGVRSEDLGHALEGTAEAVEMFLCTDLQAQPELVVLDREHLDLLRQEESLTGVWMKLKGSTELLEASLRRAPDGKSLEVALLLTPAASGEPLRQKVVAPMDDAQAWRQGTVDAVMAALKQKPVTHEQGNPEREAELFDRESNYCGRMREPRLATRAAQTALLLAPNAARRLRLASTLEGESFRKNDQRLSEEMRVRALRAGIRAGEIVRDLLREDLDRLERGQGDLLFSNEMAMPRQGTAGNVLAPAEGEAAVLRDEFARLDEEVFQLKLKYLLNLWRKNPGGEACRRYYDAWRIGDDRDFAYLTADEQRLSIMKRIVDVVAAEPPLPVKPAEEWQRWNYVARKLCSLGDSGFYYAGDNPRPALNDALKKWLENPSPFLRLIACTSLIQQHADLKIYAPRFMDEFTRNFPDGNPARTREADSRFFIPLAGAVILSLWNQGVGPKIIEEDCRRLVGGCIERKDAAQLTEWEQHSVSHYWFRSLEWLGRWRDGDELLAKMIETYRQGGQRAIYTLGIKNLQELRTSLSGKLGAPPASQTGPTLAEQELGWNDYNITEIKLDGYPDTVPGGTRPTLAHGDRFYSVWEEPEDTWHNPPPGQFDVYTLRARGYALPKGGAPVLDVKLSYPRTKYGPKDVTCLACTDKSLYAATRSGVAVFPLDGTKPWMLDEQSGLPESDVNAVECHEGNLYLLLGDRDRPQRRAFACYDPATRACRLIVSTAAKEPRADMRDFGGLDIQGIVSDPKQKCLWLMKPWALWRYRPQEDRFEKVMAAGRDDPRPPLRPLLAGPPQGAQFPLLWGWHGVGRSNLYAMGLAVGVNMPSPIVVDGGNVIAGGGIPTIWHIEKDASEHETLLPFNTVRQEMVGEKMGGRTVLVLFRPGKAPAAKVVSGCHVLLETEFGILAVTGGKAYLIKRKAEAPK